MSLRPRRCGSSPLLLVVLLLVVVGSSINAGCVVIKTWRQALCAAFMKAGVGATVDTVTAAVEAGVEVACIV